jgi:TIR domain
MTDVFISYAHLDNVPFGEEQKRWVDDFHRDLATRLQHLRRAPVSIWRDPKLLGNDVFGAEIEERVKDASVLLVVLSPPYSQSEWCRRELELFLRAAEEEHRLQFGSQLVVVKVVKLLVDENAVPERLRSTLGYQFYREDPQSGKFRELFLHPDPEIRRAYWPKIDDVAQDLVRLLEVCAEATQPGPPVPAGPTVYLAESTSDVARERDLVRRELTARGFRVLPETPLPLCAGDLEQAVDAALEGAVLSVHLLGARYGVVPEGGERSVGVVQHERAALRQIPRVLWIPTGLGAVEESQRAFLEAVRQDPAAGDRVDVLEATLDELKTLVVSRLERPQPKAPAAAPRDAALPPFVYVVSDRADAAEMPALEARLRAAGLEVAQTAFEGDVTQLREDHEETLRVCDAVLVYWGKGDDLWRRAKLRDLIRIRGRGRTQPFVAQAVLLADPPSPAKEGFTTLEAAVLRDADAFVQLVRDGRRP